MNERDLATYNVGKLILGGDFIHNLWRCACVDYQNLKLSVDNLYPIAPVYIRTCTIYVYIHRACVHIVVKNAVMLISCVNTIHACLLALYVCWLLP